MNESWHAVCEAILKGAGGNGMGNHVLQVQGFASSGQMQERAGRPRSFAASET